VNVQPLLRERRLALVDSKLVGLYILLARRSV